MQAMSWPWQHAILVALLAIFLYNPTFQPPEDIIERFVRGFSNVGGTILYFVAIASGVEGTLRVIYLIREKFKKSDGKEKKKNEEQ